MTAAAAADRPVTRPDAVTALWTGGLCVGAALLYGAPGLWAVPGALLVVIADAVGWRQMSGWGWLAVTTLLAAAAGLVSGLLCLYVAAAAGWLLGNTLGGPAMGVLLAITGATVFTMLAIAESQAEWRARVPRAEAPLRQVAWRGGVAAGALIADIAGFAWAVLTAATR